MWKILLGFAAFAALAVFVLSNAGDIDISGEKHGANVAPSLAANSSESLKQIS